MTSPLIPRDAVLDLLRSRLVRARSSEADAPAAAYLAEVLECVGCMAPVAVATSVGIKGVPKEPGKTITFRPCSSPEPYSRD